MPTVPTKPCSIPDCLNVAGTRGWCSKHYWRWLHHGDPLKAKPHGGRSPLPWEPVVFLDLAFVPVGKDVWAIVDLADLPLVRGRSWASQPADGGYGFYARGRRPGAGRQPRDYMHRVIMGCVVGDPEVDHINRNGLDNRRVNLRSASRSQNAANSGPRPGASRYKGLKRERTGRWSALIMVDRKSRYLGCFATEEEAAKAYDAAAIAAWPEHAYLNFPEDYR